MTAYLKNNDIRKLLEEIIYNKSSYAYIYLFLMSNMAYSQ
jgi:ribonucleotide reductase alpha subunit